MAAADVQQPPTEPAAPEPAPAVPDYLASPNAVFGDQGVQWRYGKAPDYSKTRAVWEQSKSVRSSATHPARQPGALGMCQPRYHQLTTGLQARK